MIRAIDRIKEQYPSIEISSKNAKNKDKASECRWLYSKDLPRRGNVFLEVWDHTAKLKDVIDYVVYKELLVEDDYKQASEIVAENSKRVTLRYCGTTEYQMLEFVTKRIERYLEINKK